MVDICGIMFPKEVVAGNIGGCKLALHLETKRTWGGGVSNQVSLLLSSVGDKLGSHCILASSQRPPPRLQADPEPL